MQLAIEGIVELQAELHSKDSKSGGGAGHRMCVHANTTSVVGILWCSYMEVTFALVGSQVCSYVIK